VQTLMAFLACFDDAVQKPDPVKQLVLELLVSYGGIAGGAAILSEGLKSSFKKMAGLENLWAFIFTFVLGLPAKYLFPNVYGPMHLRAWVFHGIVLLFLAVGAAAMRDRLLKRFTGLFSTMFTKGAADATLPAPAAAPNAPPAALPPQDQGPAGTQGGGN